MTYVFVPTKPRGPIAAMYSGPGPCYSLPNLTGLNAHDVRSCKRKQPAFSFGIKHCEFSGNSGPGPCYHPDPKISRSGMDGTPHITLHSRSREPTQFITPGPGTYKPESAGPTSKRSYPAYSLGSRLKHRLQDSTPAANNYTLPSMTGPTVLSSNKQAPCFTLRSRPRTGGFANDVSRTPGPGSYIVADPNVFKEKAPIFSMTGRNNMPGDKTKKPGPGAHSPECTWGHKVKKPSFSFGIRHSEYTAPLIVDVLD